MPVLNKIASEIKKVLNSYKEKVKKVYITGAGTIINNVDLYFQEYISNCSCEVLKPYFVQASSIKIPVKEYIEVNSAIALALNGLGNLNKELNFLTKQTPQVEDLKSLIKSKLGGKKSSTGGMNVDEEMPVMSTSEKLLIRICVLVGVAFVGYALCSNYTVKKIAEKRADILATTTKTDIQLALMSADKEKIDTTTSAYSIMLENLKKISDDVNSTDERTIEKDAIPNLLNKVMFIMPQRAKINSIENTEGKHIVMEIESREYEQLGYFMAAIKTDEILVNVRSTSGVKEGAVIKVVIEGDLP